MGIVMHTDYVQRKLNGKSSLVEWAVANCKIGSMFSRLQQGVASIVGALTNSGAENTESRRPYVVEETSTSNENSGLSDDDSGSEDGTGQVQLHPPRLRFRIDRVQVNYASPEDYSNSVLKWTCAAR